MRQALTIAGSDSGGGAGIQADLKTFHAHGVFGTSVITSVTAQNTVAVRGAFDLPLDIIDQQLEAVFDDFEISSVKTGMLSSARIVERVSQALRERAVSSLVVDPVMISKSGYRLLRDDAVESVKHSLLPLARVVTPNIHEAQLLADVEIRSDKDVEEAGRRIHRYGCHYVLVKGGHAEFNRATDVLFDGKEFHRFASRFFDTANTHGTGCTYSAAITARLALGEPVLHAIEHAKHYISRAIEHGPSLGRGHGPTHHFYFIDSESFRQGA